MKDNLTSLTKALPAAGASALTDALDLGALTAARRTPTKIRFALPALPNLADDKNCTIELYDCDTVGGTYAAVEGVGNMVVTGASSAGSAAAEWEILLPPSTRQFIKGRATIDASGGTNTDKSLTFEVVW